jgi:hypothetical protein
MLVVVASRFDDDAQMLARRWAPSVARVLLPRDLSQPHWRYYPDNLSASTAFISGHTAGVPDITGVLTLIPAVFAEELDHIIEADRRYVAAEMHAFLFAWLSALRCPVINRPADGCLSGPPWAPARWLWEACRAGLDTSPPDSLAGVSLQRLTVVGSRVFPDDAADLAPALCRLARAAASDTISATFARGRFVHGSAYPDLATAGVADALRAFLDARS